MIDSKGAIETLAKRLRVQSDLPLWAVASSSTIQAIAKGIPESYGSRGRWVNLIFSVTGPSWLGLQALRLLILGVVSLWWVKSHRVQRGKASPSELFVGFGAGPEVQMFEAFQKETERHVVHLDQTKPPASAVVARPAIGVLWRMAFSESLRIVRGLRRSKCSLIHDHRGAWLTSIAIRIGTYVFYKAWAESLPSNIRRIVFISPDIPAYAVLDVIKPQQRSIVVEFRQHGFLRESVLVPTFDRIMTLNEPERRHIQETTGCDQVEIAKGQTESLCMDKKPVLLFASIYDFAGFSKGDHLDLLNEIFAWAADNAMQVIVRLHPCESEAFWVSNFPDAEIDRLGGSFEKCLTRVSPSLVISWFSTALIDALRVGILPALIMPGSEKALADIVFPLGRIAVKWPEEKDLLENLLADQGLYCDQLRCRQQEAFGVSGCHD